MNYKIGDIVRRKDDVSNPKYRKMYTFLSIVEDNDLQIVRLMKNMTGDKVRISSFTHKPIKIKTNDDSNYNIETFLYDVDLFEKVENLNE
jgi:hypothetical protein